MSVLLRSLTIGIALAALAVTLVSADEGILPDPVAKAFYQQKIATEQRLDEAERAAKLAPQPEKQPNRGYGVAIATPQPWPTGIFESANAPLPSADYRIVNVWQGVVGANNVQVYAGSTANLTDGVLVVVVTARDDLSKVRAKTFRPRQQVGGLSVASAKGSRLTLSSTSGVTLIFDAALETFVP
jgi:hypothetical protein